MRAFVTGGTGFVGAHLVRALLDRGDQVACLVRSPAKAQALGWSGVRMVHGDLSDPAALRERCAEAEVVFHVAGAIAGRDPTAFMVKNRDATANVLAKRGYDARSLVGGMKAWSLAWNVADVAVPYDSARVIQVRRTGKGCLSYLIGSAGDAVVIDPEKKWTYDPAKGFSKSRNSPWAGLEMHGRVVQTVVNGRLIYHADRGVLIP